MSLPETLDNSPRLPLDIVEIKALLERERPERERCYTEIGAAFCLPVAARLDPKHNLEALQAILLG
jgi:hypothetical protein